MITHRQLYTYALANKQTHRIIPFDLKYQLLIDEREKVGTEMLKISKAFIDYSQTIDDVYEHFENYIPITKRRVLIVFDDMIADMGSKKKLSPIVSKLFLRGRKLDIYLAFIPQSYFKGPKTIKLNSTHYFILKIPNKRENQQIGSNHSSGIDFKDFMKFY